MASTADVVERVADRHVKRLTGPLEAALRQGRARLNEGAIAAALAAGSRGRVLELVAAAISDQDLRVLAEKRQMTVWLLDVAEESADATRCAVRPTTSAAEQAMRNRSGVDANAQVAAEASEQAARALIGQNTVTVTEDIQRAIQSTPLGRRPEFIPPPTLVRQAIEEAGRVARFDATGYSVKRVNIADLQPTADLVADSELVVRYRVHLPVQPIVVNEQGVILDGNRRAASAWAAGDDKIYAVQVRNDDTGMFVEWLRWNN